MRASPARRSRPSPQTLDHERKEAFGDLVRRRSRQAIAPAGYAVQRPEDEIGDHASIQLAERLRCESLGEDGLEALLVAPTRGAHRPRVGGAKDHVLMAGEENAGRIAAHDLYVGEKE